MFSIEDELVSWFKDLYKSRTPAKSVLDADPSYKVTWTEIHQKMKELGYKGDVVELRLLWHEIHKRRKLKTFCNKVENENI